LIASLIALLKKPVNAIPIMPSPTSSMASSLSVGSPPFETACLPFPKYWTDLFAAAAPGQRKSYDRSKSVAWNFSAISLRLLDVRAPDLSMGLRWKSSVLLSSNEGWPWPPLFGGLFILFLTVDGNILVYGS